MGRRRRQFGTAPTRAMFAAIGEVAAESATLDDRLRYLFACLIDSHYGEVITAGEDQARIIQLCQRVAQYNLALDDAAMKRLQDLLDAADKLRPFRNFLVHAQWAKSKAPRMHIGLRSSRPSVRANGAHTSDMGYWTPDDALTLARYVRAVADAVDELVEDVFDSPTWPAPQRRASWARMQAMMDGIGRPESATPPEPFPN